MRGARTPGIDLQNFQRFAPCCAHRSSAENSQRVLQVIRKVFSATFANPEFKGETERMLQFQPLAFAGEEVERVNAAVFGAATGPTRDRQENSVTIQIGMPRVSKETKFHRQLAHLR